jgi:hypothetical protein
LGVDGEDGQKAGFDGGEVCEGQFGAHGFYCFIGGGEFEAMEPLMRCEYRWILDVLGANWERKGCFCVRNWLFLGGLCLLDGTHGDFVTY